MRISGGHFMGRVLQTVPGSGTRPTDARSREMLFNVLGERLIGARVLDLYGGTGSVGIEALSRGAESCVFIEQNAGACRVIRANLKALDMAGATQVWQSSVKSALRRLAADGERFDLVFADPPFSNLRELGDLCKSLDMAAPLLHNKARRQPATSSTPNLTPLAPSDTDTSEPAAVRERGQADEVNLAATSSSQVLAQAGLSPQAGIRDAEWAANPRHAFGHALDEHAPERAVDLPELPEPMLVIQHHRKQAPAFGAPFRLWREKRAGESTLSFFTLGEAPGAEGEAEQPAGS